MGVQEAVFSKRGRRPHPVIALGSGSKQGDDKKLVFFARFWKLLVKGVPWPPEAKMKILIINPNRDDSMTEAMLKSAVQFAGGDFEVHSLTLQSLQQQRRSGSLPAHCLWPSLYYRDLLGRQAV